MSKLRGRFVAVILAVLVSVGTLGCGLPDGDLELNPPIVMRSASEADDYPNRYFSFITNHNPDGLGTDVFYRIYANVNAMNRDISSIRSANTVDTQNGYNRMVGLGYRAMTTSSPGGSYFESSNGIILRIRLFDESFDSNSGDFKAGVYINSDIGTPSISVPLRWSLRKGFSFFYNNNPGKDANPVPVSGDLDYNPSGYSSGGPWYVNAYAVTVGIDTVFTTYHSTVAELGYITISP